MRLLLLIPLTAMMLLVAVPSALATTEPGLIVGVDVALKPHTVTLSGKSVRRGFYVDFKVRNTTASRRHNRGDPAAGGWRRTWMHPRGPPRSARAPAVPTPAADSRG